LCNFRMVTKHRRKEIPTICYNFPFALVKVLNEIFWGIQEAFPILENGALSLKTLVRYHMLDHGWNNA
jgi:hypothetical protein